MNRQQLKRRYNRLLKSLTEIHGGFDSKTVEAKALKASIALLGALIKLAEQDGDKAMDLLAEASRTLNEGGLRLSGMVTAAVHNTKPMEPADAYQN